MARFAIGLTNYFIRSDALSNAAWTKTELTVADGTSDVVAPYGASTTKVTETTTNANHVLQPAAAPIASVRNGAPLQVTFWVAKSSIGSLSATRRVLIFFNDGLATNYAIFNPRTGAVDVTSGNVVAQMFPEPSNSNWYRCAIYLTVVEPGQENNVSKVIVETDNGANGAAISNSYAGSTTAGFYIAGLTQAQTGMHPAQFIRTDAVGVFGGRTRGLAPASQNLVLHSQEFSNAYWTKNTGVTATDNTTDVTDPLGTNTAAKIVYNGSGVAGDIRLYRSPVFSTFAGRKNTCGIWMRTASGTKNLQLTNNVGLVFVACAVTSTWTQFLDNTSAAVDGTLQLALYDAAASNSAFTIYVWGAQVTMANRIGPYAATVDGVVDGGAIRSTQ